MDTSAPEGRGKLSDIALARIEHLILSGELGPGDHIKEQALAERFGVSRAPIREALRVLERAGLVDVVSNRGVFVRRVSLRNVLHLFDIRGTLARLAARNAAENLTKRHATYLQALIDGMEEAGSAADTDAYMRLNAAFHERISEIGGNRPLLELQRDLFTQARLFRRHALYAEGHFDDRNADHRKILTALVAGDSETAGRLSEEHVTKSKQRFIAAIRASGSSEIDVLEHDLPDWPETSPLKPIA